MWQSRWVFPIEIHLRPMNAVILTLAAVSCGRPAASEGSGSSADLPSADLPSADLPSATTCGDGVLTAGVLCLEQLSTAIPPWRLQYGRFNDDDFVDLVFAAPDPMGHRINMWLGDGEFGFAAAAEHTIGIADAVATKWFAVDLDADERTDLVEVEVVEGGGRISAYINDGDLGFSAPTTSDVVGAGEPWNSVMPFDASGDGQIALLVEPYVGFGPLHIITNSGAGSFADSGVSAQRGPCSYSTSAAIPAFGEFTGGVVFAPAPCGDVDTSSLTVVLSHAGGDLQSALVASHGPNPISAVVADLDGDGDLELLVWDLSLQTFGLFQANSLGVFQFERTLTLIDLCESCDLPTQGVGVKLSAGQFDGDPAMDLLISFAEHVHFGLNPLTDSPTWSKWGGLSAPVTGQLSSI